MFDDYYNTIGQKIVLGFLLFFQLGSQQVFFWYCGWQNALVKAEPIHLPPNPLGTGTFFSCYQTSDGLLPAGGVAEGWGRFTRRLMHDGTSYDDEKGRKI